MPQSGASRAPPPPAAPPSLPYNGTTPLAEPRRRLDVLPAPAPLSLIVIEDSPDDYDLVVARLRAAFGEVRSVRVQTRVALDAALREGGWTAVLSDHRLPGFSSIEALGLTRTLAPDLPFLIVSGAIGDELAVAAMHAGASDYVMKDKLGRLAPALSRAIDAAQAQVHRREAEAALIESEARFRSLAANLPGMVFQVEIVDGRFAPVYASEGARRLFGFSPDEVAREPGGWIARLRAADAATLHERIAEATAHAVAQPWNDAGTGFAAHWIELVAQAPGDDVDDPVRYIEITARGRRTRPARVLWDGIATDITRQKRAEAELRRSREELRELAMHLERVREEERAGIARELHDDVGSTLTGAKLQIAALRGHLAQQPPLAAQLALLGEVVDGAITASTRIMRDLRPPILDAGIVAALEWQTRSFEGRTGIACRFHSSAAEVDLAPAEAIAVFRVCQEALNNVVKHAEAGEVEVTLSVSEGELALAVADDGRGIAPGDAGKRGHFGLRGMHERAIALDGAVAVRLRDDGPGTAVVFTIPCAAAAARIDTEPSTA